MREKKFSLRFYRSFGFTLLDFLRDGRFGFTLLDFLWNKRFGFVL